MAKRTDKQIAEYMQYYISKPKDDRLWALETLARVEKKTEEEIIVICEKQGLKLRAALKGKTAALPEEKREEVKAAIREGLTLAQVAERCHVGASTAGRIRVEMQKDGEDLPKNVGGHKATKKYKKQHPEEIELNDQQAEQLADALEGSEAAQRQPEAYPGQINVDDPEPVVEEDVKVFIPGEQAGTFDAAANNPAEVKKGICENYEKIRKKVQEAIDEDVDRKKKDVEALKREIAKQRENTLKIGYQLLTEPPVPSKEPFGLPCAGSQSGEQEQTKKPVPLAKALSDFADSWDNLLFGEPEDEPKSGISCAYVQPNLWFALRDSLSEFLVGTFGAGTELTGESVEPDTERVVIRFKTADGKAMRCTLRAEGKHGK